MQKLSLRPIPVPGGFANDRPFPADFQMAHASIGGGDRVIELTRRSLGPQLTVIRKLNCHRIVLLLHPNHHRLKIILRLRRHPHRIPLNRALDLLVFITD